MAVHGFGVDPPRAADAAQVGEQPLPARLDGVGVAVGFFNAQPFKGQAGAAKTGFELGFDFVVGEQDDFNARSEQARDEVGLQEVDDRHAMVGGDEDFFGH